VARREKKKIRSGFPRIPGRSAPPQGRRGPTIFRGGRCAFPTKNRDPHRRWRDRFAVLDPARPAPGDALIFRKMMEAGMSIEQQIEELRAELSNCGDRREAGQIAAELQIALDERDRLADASQAALR